MLFFSSGGKAFREKVWQLPEAGPTAKGRALVNLLPELGSDTITTVLPLPQDETLWESLHLVFATASGNVRRNRLSDFRNVRAAGLIAMKLDEGDRLIGVATCREGDDVLLATRHGRCIRFQITDDMVRVFAGRDSSGVRGIKLRNGDEVISLSVLRHVEASAGGARGLPQIGRTPRARGNGEDEPRPIRAGPTPEAGRAGRGHADGGALRRTGGGRGNAADRHRHAASASAPRPTSTASPAAAGRASPTSRWRRATARRWRRPSRCGRVTT